MAIDVTTLGFAGGTIAAAAGIFLLLHWWQDRRAWPAFAWGLVDLTLGAAIFLLALHETLPSYVDAIVAPR